MQAREEGDENPKVHKRLLVCTYIIVLVGFWYLGLALTVNPWP